VKNRPCPEEADAGDYLRREASRVTHAFAVGPNGEADRQIHQHGRTHADQDVRAKPGRFAGDLALKTDGAAEKYGDDKLEQQVEPKRSDDVVERRRRLLCGGEDERQYDAGSCPRALSALEVAHVVRRDVR
jgi:hypothetical protein